MTLRHSLPSKMALGPRKTQYSSQRVVRQKDRVLGFWRNKDGREVGRAKKWAKSTEKTGGHGGVFGGLVLEKLKG